tara:strand:+ start:240 stop:1271 length:1032 start_codon:yes stop_codon:yes gene_type:complete
MKNIYQKVAYIIMTSLVIVISVVLWQCYIPVAFKGSEKVVTIPKGSTPLQVGKQLQSVGLIRSSQVFYGYVRIMGLKKPLRAGSFLLSPTQSIPQLIQSLQTDNGSHHLIRITVPEDYNIWEIAKRLAKKGISNYDAIVHYWHETAKKDFEDEFSFLKGVPVSTLEGYLYPETYYIPKEKGLETLTRLMLTEFQNRIIPLWDNDPAVKRSPKARFNRHQVLTIASLIQKEARLKSEMPLISAVFYNRLQKRMQLAADPTVVYAMGKSYKDKVYYKDTKVDSPYNTYKYSGFMPSPISCVSEAAFKASLTPQNVSYLFFVANKDGSHTFTNTYREHLYTQTQSR